MPIEDKAKALMAFAMPYGLFQFKVMPFGLKSAIHVSRDDGPSDTRFVGIHSSIPR